MGIANFIRLDQVVFVVYSICYPSRITYCFLDARIFKNDGILFFSLSPIARHTVCQVIKIS